jgi:hypothetical protein
MRRVARCLAPCLALVLVVASAPARAATECPAHRTPLLILGTFHMQGSAEDLVNAPPADMSTPRRQAEIKSLVARLAEFRPTRVAIESPRISTYWNDRYAAWRGTGGALGFNEIEQIGFRLADAAGLAALAPVDYPMWMDGTTAADRHQPQPAPAEPAAGGADSPLMAEVRAQVAADDRVLQDGTISAFLAYLNRPERTVLNHRWDVIAKLAPGKGTAMYETTDHATNWYKRNLRIYTNLAAIAGPGERIVLIIGAGHAHVLNSLASADPRFCLVPPADLLR